MRLGEDVTIASAPEAVTGLLREQNGEHEVTSFELFFDLVFVFAVTQLSHLLLEHRTVLGAAQTALLLLPVWRAWVDTAWVTNWFDPNRSAVRMMLVGVMLLSLIMSGALPAAFGEQGLMFAGAYVLIQVGRAAFVVAVLERGSSLRTNFARLLFWYVLSGVLWLAGGVAGPGLREPLWISAVAVDVAAPVVGFVTPGLGRSHVHDWTIAGGHLAERCQLFVIMALGESILVTGTTFAQMERSPSTVAAFVEAFLGSVILWWIYFNRSAGYGSKVMASTPDPGRLGRSAYTYFHLPMVAGIIVTAVGDDLVIAHPGGPSSISTAVVIVAGPLLFLVGHLLYKHALSGVLIPSHLVGIVALPCLLTLGTVASPLVVAGAAAVLMLGVAGWDSVIGWRQIRAAQAADATVQDLDGTEALVAEEPVL
jgi:low temperature requirement protein LtrA